MTTPNPIATTRELLIGSKNRDKAAELAALLADFGITVRTLDEFDVPDVEETGDSFAANAALKASAFAKATGLVTIADDSGLCVDALGGEPGIHSARYAGPGCSYAENNEKLLASLRGIPADQRTAQFVSVIACATPDGDVQLTIEGDVEGIIAEKARGAGGFGYDPVFFYPPAEKTFGEMEPEIKNRVSHRAQALANFREAFAKLRKGG